MDRIFTSYFCTKEDPQRNIVQPDHDFRKMSSWYNSANHLNLNGTIFHDHLVQAFTDKYSNDNIEFESVVLGTRPLNDERFYHYLNYLERHEEIDNVLMTDMFDVKFFKNPFALFETRHTLYVGDEENTIGKNRWMQKYYSMMEKHVDFDYPKGFHKYKTLSPGIFGGKRDVVMFVMKKMIEWFDKLPDSLGIDMPVFDLVMRKHLGADEIMHGFPLNSEFKEYQESGDFYIKHK